MNEIEKAWVAGLYEGEGCLYFKIDARNGAEGWELSVAMTDVDVITKLARITGVGRLTFMPRQKPTWSDKHRWMVCRRDDIAYVLEAIQPHLGTRRAMRVADFFEWYTPRHAPRVPRNAHA